MAISCTDATATIKLHNQYQDYKPTGGVKNGAQGEVPPDALDANIFGKSLLERAGVAKSVQSAPKTWEVQRQKGATLEELESGAGADYSNLTLDDIEFDI